MYFSRLHYFTGFFLKRSHRTVACHRSFCSFQPLRYSDLFRNYSAKSYPNIFQSCDRVSKFHTSKPRNAIPPVLIALLRPLVNIVAVLAGRGIRKWWNSLTPAKRRHIYENIKKNRYKFIGGASAVYLAGFCYYSLHITEAPITKRKRFILFSKDEVQHIANLQTSLLLEDYSKQLLPSHHYLYKRVEAVKDKIIHRNGDFPGIHDGSWSLNVVHDPHQRNAFVFPNKTIFVYTGMLDICSNEDQLAMILAHEMSHVLMSHMEENLSKTHFIQLLLILPVLLLWVVLPNEGALFFHWLTDKITHLMIDLPFSRSIEKEADEVGLMMIAKACYDVREASKLWEKIDSADKDKDEEKPIEWLSTHPSFMNRKIFIEEQLPLAIRIREECNCPPLTRSRL